MRYLFALILVFFSISAFGATTVIYRISSGEVKGIDPAGGNFANASSPYFNQVTDPALPDGVVWQGPDYKNRNRVLGYAKIYVGGVVRNATQEEIDTFGPAREADRREVEATLALDYLKTDPKLRRILIAVFDTFIEHEFNKYRDWFTDFQAEVAASTSLADFKTRMATLPAMPQRTLSQLKTQVEDRISADD